MATITLTVGIAGSGKSTWAREVASRNTDTIIICKDDLRQMLHGGKWTQAREKIILKARDALVIEAMRQGRNIIIADTNLEPRHKARMEQLAHEWNLRIIEGQRDLDSATYDVHVKDFTDVPVDECIKRDLLRANPVGERVIREQYNKYVRQVETPEHDPILPNCIICDLDGTLAILNGRNPYDASTCEQDGINRHVQEVLTAWGDVYASNVILFSGRQDIDREPTERWLEKYDVGYNELHMRAAGDTRKDSIIKRELYEAHVRGKYNVRLVIDDRLQVCRMWYELGLPLMRVGDPDAAW